MKLLFDQNLLPRLVSLLADVFAGSLHVRQAGLERADDDLIWRFARDGGLAIVRTHAPRIAALEQEPDGGFLILL